MVQGFRCGGDECPDIGRVLHPRGLIDDRLQLETDQRLDVGHGYA
jgi:hypothetical protein